MQRGFSRFKKQYSKAKIEVTFPKNTHIVALNQVRSHIDLDLSSSTTMKKKKRLGNYFSSLSLSVLICTMGIKIKPSSQSVGYKLCQMLYVLFCSFQSHFIHFTQALSFSLFLLTWKLRLQEFKYLLKVKQPGNVFSGIQAQESEPEH